MSSACEFIVDIHPDVDTPVRVMDAPEHGMPVHGMRVQAEELKDAQLEWMMRIVPAMRVKDADGGVPVQAEEMQGKMQGLEAQDRHDMQLEQKVQSVHGMPAPGVDTPGKGLEYPVQGGLKVEDATLEEMRRWMGDLRTILIGIAGIAAAVAYGAGLSPPGGSWQDDKENHYVAGEPIMLYKYPVMYAWFKTCNAMACTTSIMVLLMLLSADKTFKTATMFKFRILQATSMFGLICLLVAFSIGISPKDPIMGFAYTLSPIGICGIMSFALWIYMVLKRAAAKRKMFQENPHLLSGTPLSSLMKYEAESRLIKCFRVNLEKGKMIYCLC